VQGAMKLRIGICIGVLFLLISSFIGYKAIKISSDITELRHGISQGAAAEILKGKTDKVAADLRQMVAISGTPGLSSALGLAGLNVKSIQPEIQSLVGAAPLLLGSDRPKRYLIAFQNSAEARGTGGIIGAFAIVKFDRGKLSVERTGSNAILKSLETLPIPMPSDFRRIYGDDPAIWQNSNISPHFPYGAKIWMALWEKQFGEKLDGVIAVDPSALSYILKSTGAIKLKSGEVITSENVVSETLQKAYKRYEFDNLARKDFLVRIIDAAFSKIMAGQYSKIQLAQGLKTGVEENRILVFSSDKSVERLLEDTRLGGTLSTTEKNEFRVVILNIDASKLDYYLSRKTQVKSLSCNKNGEVQVELLMKNTLITGLGLPSYVLTRADKTKPAALVSGQHRFLAFIYGPPGSSLISAKRSTAFGSPGRLGEELQRPVLVVDVDLAPGQSEKVTAVFSRGAGPITYHSQPLVIAEKVAIDDKCR
jgi:Protein of unknown function (DUF4012)